MNRHVERELRHLISALCDGELREGEQQRLEELLRADNECRRLYLEYVDLHACLLVRPASEVPATTGPAVPDPAGRPLPLPQAVRYLAVAAATLAASFLLQAWWRPRAVEERPAPAAQAEAVPRLPGHVATLAQAVGCTWEHDAGRVGSRLPPGELRLRQGLARVRFDSGPELVIEGPAAVRLDSATAATVVRGKVVFQADESAAPFDLRTPSASLVDLGTEYAVVVGPEGEEVHVFDGEVERTPRTGAASAEPERLTAGEARRYGSSPEAPGQPTALEPERFARELPAEGRPPADARAGLLAYEGFAYPDPAALDAGRADGGTGWAGPWRPGFARPLNEGDENRLALNVHESLVRPGAAAPSAGGCFDYTGFSKYFRRLATPVRLDADGIYYLSFLVRRQGPPADSLNAVAVLFRTDEELERELQERGEDRHRRLNIGLHHGNDLFTHLERVGNRTPLPLTYGETYLLVAKIVASAANDDQVFMRVYGSQEPVEPDEPSAWSAVGPPYRSDLVFDWLEVHINSKTRQTIDEIRLGTTWVSVTVPWVGPPGTGKEGKK